MTKNLMEGGCRCGRVRYAVRGAPREVVHCHCVDCRRSSGAAFVTWATFRYEDFSVSQGEPRLVDWADRLRSFCPHCGTPLLFMASIEADEVDVTVASLDHPESVTPTAHIWTEDQLPWARVEDGLPRYPKDS